jgi:hypothetical protein
MLCVSNRSAQMPTSRWLLRELEQDKLLFMLKGLISEYDRALLLPDAHWRPSPRAIDERKLSSSKCIPQLEFWLLLVKGMK